MTRQKQSLFLLHLIESIMFGARALWQSKLGVV